MNKKVLKAAFIAAVAMMTGINVFMIRVTGNLGNGR